MPHFELIHLRSSNLFPLEPHHFPILLPPYFFLLMALLGVDIWLHSSGEQTLIFLKIAYIYLILQQLLPPFDFKVEPLQMASRVAIDPHEAIILSLSHPHHAVQIPTLEKGIKEEVVLSLPMLPAEGPIRKLHIIWCLDVIIGKAKGLIIPSIISVLIPWAKVTQFGTLFGHLEHLPYEVIEALTLEDDRNGDGKFQFRLPTNHSMHLYPISMSGRSE